MGNDIAMSMKKIAAGDTLTVGDLTDDHLGAEIEVGTIVDVTYRFAFGGFVPYAPSMTSLWTPKVRVASFYDNDPVKVITPPPVVQPNEPTVLGQCIRIEGDDGFRGVVADPEDKHCLILDTDGYWWHWNHVLSYAGKRQIIVSDPPRWPDETPEADDTPEAPKLIEDDEWPDDDTHLREWEWIGHLDYRWRWYAEETRKSGWAWTPDAVRRHNPIRGPWTRGERVE